MFEDLVLFIFCSVIIEHLQGFIAENADALLTAEDFQGNTIAHLVAASGNTEVFEVICFTTVMSRSFRGQKISC